MRSTMRHNRGKSLVKKFLIPCSIKTAIKDVRSNIKAKKVLNIFPRVSRTEYLAQISEIKKIDKDMIGRYCGSLEDKIVQSMCCYDLATRFPSSPRYCHVEIGVLFGGSILAKLSVLKRLNVEQTIVAIDPFEGFYGEAKDPLTELKVSEDILLRNIEKFGFDPHMVRIVKRRSTDPQVKHVLSEYKVISLMIDGDHTYAEVRGDWESYSDLLQIGGRVIFDDYEEPAHPDVTTFVNELIEQKSPQWEIVGRLDTTFVIQRQSQDHIQITP